jgi:hypothetical protein
MMNIPPHPAKSRFSLALDHGSANQRQRTSSVKALLPQTCLYMDTQTCLYMDTQTCLYIDSCRSNCRLFPQTCLYMDTQTCLYMDSCHSNCRHTQLSDQAALQRLSDPCRSPLEGDSLTCRLVQGFGSASSVTQHFHPQAGFPCTKPVYILRSSGHVMSVARF